MFTELSNAIADVVAQAAPSVVQVHGHRRPASGLAYGDDLVITTMHQIGRDDRPRVRRDDGTILESELAGWDPATQIALLRVPGLASPALSLTTHQPRVGELAVAVARSWSNALTASAGLVSVIGGPFTTGRRRSIDRIIRTSAAMHDGFSGGAFLDAGGHLLGMTTAAAIRGLCVVIPADIAWASAREILEHGGRKRGYLGIAAQTVSVPEKQRGASGPEQALLVVGIKLASPAADAGILVGDLLVSLDGHLLTSPEELLDLLAGDRVGRPATVTLLRGTTSVELAVVVGERQERR